MKIATDRQEFLEHLRILKRACDEAQPFADLDGNFASLHALMNLEQTARLILSDISALLGRQ